METWLNCGVGGVSSYAQTKSYWVFEDWNNVATLQDFTPYGLPAGSRPHNDSAGIYGQVVASANIE